METAEQARKLLRDSDAYQNWLIDQARATSKFRDIMQFVVECLDFAEKQFPEPAVREWSSTEKFIPLLAERAGAIFENQISDPKTGIIALNNSAGSAVVSTFSFITQNYNYLENKQARSEYARLTGLYRGVVNSEEDQSYAYNFLETFNSKAAKKFKQANDEIQSLPVKEDPQGPLVAMRSAIELALRSLLELTPLTRSERSDLKKISYIPIIAQHLAKDETSKVDLILANEQFEQLRNRLSSSKDLMLQRDIAESLMSQATSLLNLLARTISTKGID